MYAQKKPIENTRIVRERDRQRFRELLAVFSVGIPVGLFLLLFTWENLEVIRLGRDTTRLRTEQRELEQENKRLRLHLERMTSLGEVEKRARSLGFVETDEEQIVVARTGGSVNSSQAGSDARTASAAIEGSSSARESR